MLDNFYCYSSRNSEIRFCTENMGRHKHSSCRNSRLLKQLLNLTHSFQKWFKYAPQLFYMKIQIHRRRIPHYMHSKAGPAFFKHWSVGWFSFSSPPIIPCSLYSFNDTKLSINQVASNNVSGSFINQSCSHDAQYFDSATPKSSRYPFSVLCREVSVLVHDLHEQLFAAISKRHS